MDLTYDKALTDIYSVLEPTLGIICACLATMRPIFERVLPSGLGGLCGSAASLNRTEKKSANNPVGRVISPGSGVVHKGYMKSVTSNDGIDCLNTTARYALEATQSMEKEAGSGIDLDCRNISITRVWDVERQ